MSSDPQCPRLRAIDASPNHPGRRVSKDGKSEMMQSFLWLVIAVFGLQSPALPQHDDADDQATKKGCVAESRSSETSPPSKDAEARGETTAPGAEDQQGLAAPCASRTEADDRAYLLQTARVSATMTSQGPETAIARLNPGFVARLASAIREARESGLSSAGIFSAYRAPASRVGRFLDRFKSLHAYGLAVDMWGIGDPGSSEAKLWYDIAGRHGIFCPYGVDSRTEWNHCQPTPIKMICPDNPLRKTITAQGPITLAEMFKVGNSVIENPPAVTCATVAANRPQDSQAVSPHAARAAPAAPSAVASAAASDRVDRKQASVAASEHLDRKHPHDRNAAGDAFARAKQSEKARMLMVTADLRLGGKSHPRVQAEVKAREPRKAARGSEGHRDSTRHHSRLASR